MADLARKFLTKGSKTTLTRPAKVSRLSTKIDPGKAYKKTSKKTLYILKDGPFDGRTIMLYEPCTLEFSIKSYDERMGRYTQGDLRGTLTWEFVE